MAHAREGNSIQVYAQDARRFDELHRSTDVALVKVHCQLGRILRSGFPLFPAFFELIFVEIPTISDKSL